MHLYSSYQESSNRILLQGLVTSWWMSRGGGATSILRGAELGGAARVQRRGEPGSCVGSTVGSSAALQRGQGAGDVPRISDKKQKCHRRGKKKREEKKETKQSPARETVLLPAPTRTCALLSGTAVKLQGKQRWYFAMVGEGWGLGHAVEGIRVWLLCEQGLQNPGSDMPRTMRAER